jgi:hypothetical protein
MEDLDGAISAFRGEGAAPPFAGRDNLAAFCAAVPGLNLSGGGYGYKTRTAGFSYYFRLPMKDFGYDMGCYPYDNRLFLPTMAAIMADEANEGEGR